MLFVRFHLKFTIDCYYLTVNNFFIKGISQIPSP